MSTRRKLETLKVEDWPEHLQDQVRNYNGLVAMDEFHRTRDLTDEEEIKWLEARVKLHKAKAALLDARADYHRGKFKKAEQDFWKTGAKSLLGVAVSFIALYYNLINAGLDTFWVWVIIGGTFALCAALIFVLFRKT